MQKMKQQLQSLGRETWLTSWELIRLIVPVAILTKILDDAGMIGMLSGVLEPVMELIGLPGSLGLVWATAMITTLYGGMAVFATLAPGLDLTSAQITVLCSAMLIAHSLPIELAVSKRAGATLMPILLLRLLGAFVYAFLLHQICQHFQLWQDVPSLLFSAGMKTSGYLGWVLELVRNVALIVVIICLILVAMKILKKIGALGLLERLLYPVLPLFGMGRNAAPITVVGMVMGIGYGGALIIRETNKGKLSRSEVFNSMALMGLCHGLVEDTLLMVALGGKLGGILLGRIVFSLVLIFFLVRLLRALRPRGYTRNQKIV
jgi:spore maturation protein SpmB